MKPASLKQEQLPRFFVQVFVHQCFNLLEISGGCYDERFDQVHCSSVGR